MNRRIRRAVGLTLAASGIALHPLDGDAISQDGTITTFGANSHTGTVPRVAWDGNNSSRATPTIFNGTSKNLGWAHNVKWFDVNVTKSGNYKISLVRTDPALVNFHPAFSLWPVGPEPFDFLNCLGDTPSDPPRCGDAKGVQSRGTHSFNQVAAPSLTNSSAWLLGPNGPDTNPLGEPLSQSLKWKPRPGTGAVTGFVGYANSGTGGWKNGMPINTDGGRFGSDTAFPDFNISTDQNDVLQGGMVQLRAADWVTLDERSNVDAPYAGGSAAMNLYGLKAGHYLLALGGSCQANNCGKSDSDTYRLEIQQITGLPQAFVTANSAVRMGSPVLLDGSSSIGADGGTNVTYVWEQTGGTPVTLNPGGSNARQSFTAPPTVGALSFALKVKQGQLTSDAATVQVVVTDENNPPVIRLQPQTGVEGALITLAPTVTDADGDKATTYAWQQTAGPTVVLSSNDKKDISFTAPYVGTSSEPLQMSFRISATDDFAANPKTASLDVPVLVYRDPTRLDCSRATARPASLWRPSGQLRPLSIDGVASPNGQYQVVIDSIQQTEPVQDRAAKDRTGPDGRIQRGKAKRNKPRVDTAQLRAERQRNGSGRLYFINFTAQTVNGTNGLETCKGTVQVEAPLTQGATVADNGQRFNSLSRR
jgi:hypothetical protein